MKTFDQPPRSTTVPGRMTSVTPAILIKMRNQCQVEGRPVSSLVDAAVGGSQNAQDSDQKPTSHVPNHSLHTLSSVITQGRHDNIMNRKLTINRV